VTTAVRAEGLVRCSEGRTLVRVEALTVEPGEVLGILGANGAGKSTLLRMLALLEPFDEGRMWLFDEPVGPSTDRLALRRRTALVLQKSHLLDMTVLDNAATALRFRGRPAAEARVAAENALSLFGVAGLADRHGHQLSGGEAQRVSLARALAGDPELLLLDEPFAQLDQPSRESLVQDIGDVLRGRGQTVVLVTHDRDEILRLATRVAVLAEGRILQHGPVAEVFAHPACPAVAAFVGMDSFLTGQVVGRDGDLAEVRAEGFGLRVLGDWAVGTAVRVHVHPGDIVLAPAGCDVSARNRLPCRVVAVESRGATMVVALSPRSDGAGRLQAVVTRHAVGEMGVVVGHEVDALVKATALKAYAV